MKLQQIARRYASALLEGLPDEGEARTCQLELELAAEVFSSAQVDHALASPSFNADDQRAVLKDLADEMQLSPRLKRFVEVLFEAGRLRCIRQVARVFGPLLEDRFRSRRAVVRAAAPLDPALLEQLTKRLEERTGDRVEIEFVKDPRLIAGWRARVGNYLIEADLRSRGKRFRESLVKG